MAKNATKWINNSGSDSVSTSSTANTRTTNNGNTRVTKTGDTRVVSVVTVTPKHPTVWADS